MKASVFLRVLAQISLFSIATSVVNAQQTVVQSLGILDEKVSRLQAQIEDLQFQLQKDQKDIQKLQTDLEELRRSGGSVSANDIRALDDRIAAVDAARQKDKQAIIDQLAKELAAIGTARSSTKGSASAMSVETKEYVVQKGDTLTTIAKSHGVTIAELKKANDLTSDDIRVGQKLAIPPH
jgi:LysM repeat protein